MKFELNGLDELMNELENTQNNAKRSKDEALKSGAEIIQKGAQDSVQVRTGILKEHIKVSDVENEQIEVYVDNQGRAFYGFFVEFGTSKMRAIPFMGPAFMRNRLRVERAMADSLRQSLGLIT